MKKIDLEKIATERNRELTLWVQMSPEFIYSCHYTPEAFTGGNIVINEPVDDFRSIVFIGSMTDRTPASGLPVRIREIIRANEYADLPAIAGMISDAVWGACGGCAALNGAIIDYSGKCGLCKYINAGMPDVLHLRKGFCDVDMTFTPAVKKTFGARPGIAFSAKDVRSQALDENDIVMVATPDILELTSDDVTTILYHQTKISKLCRDIFCSGKSDYVHLAELPFRIVNELASEENTEAAKKTTICSFVKTRFSGTRFYRSVPVTRRDVDGLTEQIGFFISGRSGREDLKARAELLLSEFLVNICDYENEQYGEEAAKLTVALGLAQDHLRVWVWHCAKKAKAVASDTMEEADAQLDRCNDEMSGSGRGLAIIRKLATYISVKTFANLTRYCFHLPYKYKGEIS